MQPTGPRNALHSFWGASGGLDKLHFTHHAIWPCLPTCRVRGDVAAKMVLPLLLSFRVYSQPPKSAMSAGHPLHGLANTQAQARGLLLATPATTPRRGGQACTTTWPCQRPARVGAPPHRGLHAHAAIPDSDPSPPSTRGVQQLTRAVDRSGTRAVDTCLRRISCVVGRDGSALMARHASATSSCRNPSRARNEEVRSSCPKKIPLISRAIMGSQNCGIVRKSQSVLVKMNPMISTRTQYGRTPAHTHTIDSAPPRPHLQQPAAVARRPCCCPVVMVTAGLAPPQQRRSARLSHTSAVGHNPELTEISLRFYIFVIP
jgi:hypothetical protein